MSWLIVFTAELAACVGGAYLGTWWAYRPLDRRCRDHYEDLCKQLSVVSRTIELMQRDER